MDEGYEKIMEIIEMSRFRQRLGLLDYTACWEEPDRVKGLDIEATKNRIRLFLNRIAEEWEKHPDLRFGQFVME